VIRAPRGQLDALSAAGCEQVWTDVTSGVRTSRPALEELLSAAAAGDTVVVTRLDRLGRSLPNLLDLVEDLAAKDVGLRSLAEQIDTSSATGRLVFGALAEFERGINHEHNVWLGGRPGARAGRRTASGA
jgi:DNA invertase Pin-like site-specific DNA recombinase